MLLAEIFENIRKDSINPYFFGRPAFGHSCFVHVFGWRGGKSLASEPRLNIQKCVQMVQSFTKILTKFAYIFKLSKYERRFKNLLEKVGT